MQLDNCYIAARFSAGPRICLYAIELEKLRYRIICPWWANPLDQNDKDLGSAASRVLASYDLDSVISSKLFIIDTFEESNRGGREVELGIALAMERRHPMRLIHVGPYRNIFHSLVREHYDSWSTLLAVLKHERMEKRNMGNG